MGRTVVCQEDIEAAINRSNLAGKAICLHSSLHSFGYVDGGAQAVVQAFLQSNCTLLVPSFSWTFAIPAPVEMQLPQNGWDYENYVGPSAGIGRIYTPDTSEVDKEMGAISAFVAIDADSVRGDHPICSFSAVGPHATELIKSQAPDDVFAPLHRLGNMDGIIVLAGVALDKMTLIHLAEKEAGRVLFRRFANDINGNSIAVEVGGCSDGFLNLATPLQSLNQTTMVGMSEWSIFPAQVTIDRAVQVIRSDPAITHCGIHECDRCNDAVKGGPIL